MDLEIFKRVIDELHDEIMIYDNEYRLVYVNKAAYRHYGVKPEDLIGKCFHELDGTYWGNSTLPDVYRTQKQVAKRQITNKGHDIITISVPVFDDIGRLQYVAQNVNDLYYVNTISQAEAKSVEIDTGADTVDRPFRGTNNRMAEIFSMIHKIKDVTATCLFSGETGTGKSYFAKYMHTVSNRKQRPFVTINCACMNPNLIESELFGYSRGAFSGASNTGKRGLVEVADKGILFLDEISEIPYDLQAKLLLFLQDKEFIPVGAAQKKKVDVKIITATNRNLRQMVEAGSFREDLYYRLNTFEIDIPPLRERLDEIPALADYYLAQCNETYKKFHTFHPDVYRVFQQYSWPGNLRELAHIIEKIVVLTQQAEIEVTDLPKTLFDLNAAEEDEARWVERPLSVVLEMAEREAVQKAYQTHKNSVKVGKALGISQSKAYRLLKKYVYSAEK